MTMMHKIAASTLAIAALTATTVPAFAGGLSEPIATPEVTPMIVTAAPSNDWTGFYVGGQLGYGKVTADDFDEDATGATYGVHAGYLYDLGTIVLGGELDYDATTIEGTVGGDDVAVDGVARAKLRIGYDAGDWMPDLTVGGARAMTSGAVDGEGDGTFAGLGLDYRLSDSLRVGAEVLQHQFDDFDDTDGQDLVFVI